MLREKAIAALVVALLVALAGAALSIHENPGSSFAKRAAGWPIVGAAVRALAGEESPAPRAASAVTPPVAVGTAPPAWLYEPAAAAWLSGKPPAVAGRAVPPSAVDVVAPPSRPRLNPGGRPPLGEAAAPVLPVPARPADPERLARALASLGQRGERLDLAGYAGYSDLGDAGLAGRMRALAAGLEGRYRERLGRTPIGAPAESIVLFAREADYRAFQQSEARLADLAIATGHSGYGLVALYAGGRAGDEIVATLTHELVHLLNRRAIGPALPPWLDEGLAEDLAESPLDERGLPRLGDFSGAPERQGDRVELRGGLAALESLGRALETTGTPALVSLARLDWESFVAPDQGAIHYAEGFLFVRFLLDGGDAGLERGFRNYLDAVAHGESAEPETLERELGRSLAALEAPYRAWVTAERAKRLGYLAALRAASLPTIRNP